MARKKVGISFKVPEVEKEVLEVFAKTHGTTLSQLCRKGARFYAGMTPMFLHDLERFQKDYQLNHSVILELVFRRQMASLYAWKNVFGSFPRGFRREYIKDEKGQLMRGENLSKELQRQYEELFRSIKEKLTKSRDENEPVMVSEEEFSEFSVML